MRSDLSVSAIVAGLIAVIVSYAGPPVIIFQAAAAAQLDQAQVSSWIWAVSIGSGVSAIALSLWSRAPIVTAWSTPRLIRGFASSGFRGPSRLHSGKLAFSGSRGRCRAA